MAELDRAVGESVHVVGDNFVVEASVEAWNGEVWVRAPDGSKISLERIESIAVDRTDRAKVYGSIGGFVVGAALGGAIGVWRGTDYCARDDEEDPCGTPLDWTARQKVVIYGSLLGLFGALVGGIGAVYTYSRDVFTDQRSPWKIHPHATRNTVGISLDF